jgi:hypothetical protein
MTTLYESMDGATLKFADEVADLATATVDASCQIKSAVLTTVDNEATVDATFCTPAGTTVLASGAALDVTAYSDWSDPDGFCWFTADADGTAKAFELTMPSGGKFTGMVGVRRAAYGGDAGATPEFTLSLPVVPGTLTPTKPTAAAAPPA